MLKGLPKAPMWVWASIFLKRANVVSVFMTGSPFLLAFLASGIMGKLWGSEIPWKPIDFMASSYRKIGIV